MPRRTWTTPTNTSRRSRRSSRRRGSFWTRNARVSTRINRSQLMKVLTVTQRSPEWHAARVGIPTASEFHRIVTPVKGDLAKAHAKYAHELVAETLLGRAVERAPGTPWAMARGRAFEPLAMEEYERTQKVTVDRV